MHSRHLLSALLGIAAASCGTIKPGSPWSDTSNKLLQAHGGAVYEQDGTYYLIGENKTKTQSNPRGNYFNSVACYTSKNLQSWEFRNDLLSFDSSIPDLGAQRIIERPKIVYNERSGQYVMWMHVDSSNYSDARSGVAVSDSLCGKYTYKGSQRPLGHIARDMTLFVDDDKTAYLVAEDRKEGTHFFQLSDDYLSVASLKGTIPFSFMSALEAPAVVKVGGVYYFFGSRLTGWDANDNQYTTSNSLAGPWAKPATFAPSGSKTCSSQTTFIFPGQHGKFMYMGDRWFKDKLDESQYIWLPLAIDSKARTAKMTCKASWSTSEVGV